MTYISLDVCGPYGWSPRRAARERHPVAAIHSTPCAVRCERAASPAPQNPIINAKGTFQLENRVAR